MSWAKIDDLLPHHRKLLDAGAQSPAVFGLYVASICYAQRQKTDGHIPHKALALILPGCPRPSTRLLETLVDLRLWDLDEDGWRVHDFLEWNATAETRKAKAKNAAHARWDANGHAPGHAVSNPPADASPLLSETETETTPKPKPIPRDPSPPTGGFARFWDAYPSKVGKQAALKAWVKNRCEGKTAAILAALDDPKLRAHLTREGGKYVPNPATWLNAGRWEDEPPDVRPGDDRTHRNVAGIQAWLAEQDQALKEAP